jgi:hypothetical protein
VVEPPFEPDQVGSMLDHVVMVNGEPVLGAYEVRPGFE